MICKCRHNQSLHTEGKGPCTSPDCECGLFEANTTHKIPSFPSNDPEVKAPKLISDLVNDFANGLYEQLLKDKSIKSFSDEEIKKEYGKRFFGVKG